MVDEDELNQRQRDKLEREGAEPAHPLLSTHTATGIVKWWRDTKGYGAISTEVTAPFDVWCHFSAVEGEGDRSPNPGERVEVEFIRTDQESFKYVANRLRRLV